MGGMIGGKELCRYHTDGAGRNDILTALDAIGRSALFFVTGSFFYARFRPMRGLPSGKPRPIYRGEMAHGGRVAGLALFAIAAAKKIFMRENLHFMVKCKIKIDFKLT